MLLANKELLSALKETFFGVEEPRDSIYEMKFISARFEVESKVVKTYGSIQVKVTDRHGKVAKNEYFLLSNFRKQLDYVIMTVILQCKEIENVPEKGRTTK